MKKLVILGVFSCVTLFANEKASIAADAPLQKLKSFAFFAHYDPDQGKNYEKLKKIIVSELEKIGTVVQTKKQDDQEQIDVSGFASGTFLTFEIENILTLDEKEVPVMNASLSLSSQVKVKKTDVSCFANTWATSCFLEGTFNKSPEKAISKSLQNLLQQFLENYNQANPGQKERPTFYTYL